MPVRTFAAAYLLLGAAFAAQPLPELRIEAVAGGSVLYVRNGASQPLTAFLIELVDYPGSYYALWQDNVAGTPIAPGVEKRFPISNMTVGAVPDYVKLQAALYSDGSSAGIPEKITQLIERRRFVLETTRELIRRTEKAQSGKEDKAAFIASVEQWSRDLPPPGRANRTSQASINQAAGRITISEAIALLRARSFEDALADLRASERALAAAKPAL